MIFKNSYYFLDAVPTVLLLYQHVSLTIINFIGLGNPSPGVGRELIVCPQVFKIQLHLFQSKKFLFSSVEFKFCGELLIFPQVKFKYAELLI